MENKNYTLKELISKEEIAEKTKELAKKISEEYEGKPLLLVSILKGGFIFLADLCREISIPLEINFMKVESYFSGTVSTGQLHVSLDVTSDISNHHVIIVEDIIDSGRTLSNVMELFKGRNPLSLKVVTLLDKPSRRAVEFNADTSLFTIDDLFVVGYGLDYAERYRNLPYIAELID